MPTWTACAARVRVNRTNGHVTVEKLSLVIDAGTVIHPDSAEAQVEGAALWGLSVVLHEGSEFVKGQPKDTNLDTYALLRMADVPDVEVSSCQVRKHQLGLVNRRPRRLRLRLEMPSSLPRGARPSSANPTASRAGSARGWKFSKMKGVSCGRDSGKAHQPSGYWKSKRRFCNRLAATICITARQSEEANRTCSRSIGRSSESILLRNLYSITQSCSDFLTESQN